MRAGAWSANRDHIAARVSWERARSIADALPADDPDQSVDAHRPSHHAVCHRLARPSSPGQSGPASRSCGSCAALPGTRSSLAIGMTGLATELVYAGRPREGSRLASEQMALLESIGDPTPTMALAFIAFGNWFEVGESARSCGGRRPLSTWPTATPPRAPASVWDRRWRSRWHGAALLGGGWAIPDGAKTSDDAVAMARSSDPHNLRRCRRLDLRCGDLVRGASGR